MTMVMDSSSVVTMAETGADALGFVFDASSGLYYDASSGFYYDANAGWYYDTQNGHYYVYANDAYVPLAATISSETLPPAVGDEVYQSPVLSATRSPNREEHIRDEVTIEQESSSETAAVITQTAVPSADQEADVRETPFQLVENNSIKDAVLETSDSEWQDALCGHVQSVAEYPRDSGGFIPGTEMSLLSMETVTAKNSDTAFEAVGQAESVGEPEETRPASVWIAEALTELYSQNAYEEPNDGGEPELYVDPSSQHRLYQSNSNLDSAYEYSYVRDDNEESWHELQHHDRRRWGDAAFAWDDHATMDNDLYESDEQSEELEEGEWRPEEEEKENYIFADVDEVEEGEIREDPIEDPGNSGVDGEGNGPCNGGYPTYRKSSPTNGEGRLDSVGNIVEPGYLRMPQGSIDVTGNEMDICTLDVAAEEQWQAQYLPTVTSKARSHFGSMDLWDWSIIEQEKKIGRKKVKKMFRLIGRLAPNATQVHPSLRGSGGLIRTTPILEADHDFVKVSSGRIYKLRRPSSKHLTAYPGYVSSNPTQDWGFPIINVDTEEDHIDTSPGPTLSSLTGSGYFVKQLASKKKYARLKIKGIDGEPQPKYRDRAAERRTLHKGFGIGPGQKAVSVHELEKEEADAATEMPGALEKAASARPIGRDNIGKRMLEGMGWKEGQSLGCGEGGLVDPILALGNAGRTGLGWG